MDVRLQVFFFFFRVCLSLVHLVLFGIFSSSHDVVVCLGRRVGYFQLLLLQKECGRLDVIEMKAYLSAR